jgi:hypothetical protein
VSRIVDLLDAKYGLGPLQHTASYHMATLYGRDWPSAGSLELGQTDLDALAGVDPLYATDLPWPGLHTDFLSSDEEGPHADEEWMYTCLLYLSSAVADVTGAGTGVADALDETGRTVSGLVVEPAYGRLFCFSSGAENFHARRSFVLDLCPCFWVLCLFG